MELIEYSKCSTCSKAKKFLNNQHIDFTSREIKEQTPNESEIKNWLKKYNIDIHKLFNTSGLIYRKLDLKNKLKNMSEEEKINLLAHNAMLIKRPILVTDKYLLIGFKEKEWLEKINS